jgi:hypothetical protein
MYRKKTIFDPGGQIHEAKVKQKPENSLLILEIANVDSKIGFESVVVTIWLDDENWETYEFSTLDVMQDHDKPGIAILVLPWECQSHEPPFIVNVFSNDPGLDLRDWTIHVCWISDRQTRQIAQN